MSRSPCFLLRPLGRGVQLVSLPESSISVSTVGDAVETRREGGEKLASSSSSLLDTNISEDSELAMLPSGIGTGAGDGAGDGAETEAVLTAAHRLAGA